METKEQLEALAELMREKMKILEPGIRDTTKAMTTANLSLYQKGFKEGLAVSGAIAQEFAKMSQNKDLMTLGVWLGRADSKEDSDSPKNSAS